MTRQPSTAITPRHEVLARVEYRAVAILSRTRAYHDAWASYSGSVIPDRSEEG